MSTSKKATAGSGKDAPSFEEDLARLEVIIESMESGKSGLDEMIKLFEEGSELVKRCSNKLGEVEQKIERLVKKDGKYATEPFDPSSAS